MLMKTDRDSRARLVAVCVLVAFLVTVVAFGFDRLLGHEGATRVDILLASNGLTGVVAGFLFYSLSNQERQRRNLVQERLRIIADMNHHIRNALQVITYATASQKHSESVQLIGSSVERIEWALREVLPGGDIAANTEDGAVGTPLAATTSAPREASSRSGV